MKKLALAILMTLPMYANATGRENPHNQAANMLQGQAQYQNQTGGNSSVSVDNDTKMPASSAIAPSVGTNNNCLIATPSSAAVNILFGGVSKTTGFHYSGLCLAYRMNDMALVEKLMCLEDMNYAKLNSKCSK